MATLRALIADSEAQTRHSLYQMLAGAWDVEMVATCESASRAVEVLQSHDLDVAFLEVQRPQLDGFEVLRRAGRTPPAVVFVAPHDQYALGAFEAYAVDYLVKPVAADRLEKTLVRVKEHLRLSRPAPRPAGRAPDGDAYAERLAFRQGRSIRFIDVAHVDWIEAADNYVQLHAGTRAPLVRTTMNALEERLDPDRFLRIHRSYIVRVGCVAEVRPLGSGDALVVLGDGTRLRSSRTYGAARRRFFSGPC